MRIIPYRTENYKQLLNEINGLGKVKFEKVGSWDNTLISCIRALRILKTLEINYYSIKEEYNITYKMKLFYKGTTISFRYNRIEYRIEILTGLTLPGDDFTIDDSPITFSVLEKDFNNLIREMEYELPSQRSANLKNQLEKLASREL